MRREEPFPIALKTTKLLARQYAIANAEFIDPRNDGMDKGYRDAKSHFIRQLGFLDLNAWFVQTRLRRSIESGLEHIRGTRLGRDVTPEELAKIATKLNKLVQKVAEQQAPKTIAGKFKRTLYNIFLFATTPFIFIFGRASTNVHSSRLCNAIIDLGENYRAVRDHHALSKYPILREVKQEYKEYTKTAFKQGLSADHLVAAINQNEPAEDQVPVEFRSFAIAETNRYAEKFAPSQGYFPTFNRYVASAAGFVTSIPEAVHDCLPHNPFRSRTRSNSY